MQVDLSTYPKAAPIGQPTMLDTVGKLQGVEQQSLAINQAQMNQINQGYTYLMRELNSLPPNATADDMRQYATNAVKMRLIPNDMAAQFISTIPNDPAQIPEFKKVLAAKLLNASESIQHWYGQQTTVNDNQTITPAAQSPFFGIRPTGAPIQIQQPPSTQQMDTRDTTQVMGPNGQPQNVPNPNYGATSFIGARPPQLPDGTVPIQGGFPAQYQPAPSAPTPRFQATPPVAGAPTPSPTVVAPPTPPMQTGPSTGLPTGMPETIGLESKQLNEDRQLASTRLNAIIPLRQAYPLISQVATGIGTQQFQTIKAALYQIGVLQRADIDDTIAYQEMNKYMARYLINSGATSRSDEAQKLAQSAMANPGTQLNPALMRIVRSQVALDRIESARALGWRGPETGRGYGQHRANFPTTVDEKAFSFDFLPSADRDKLLDEMNEKAKSSNANTRALAEKFFTSLRLASPRTPNNPTGLGLIQLPD